MAHHRPWLHLVVGVLVGVTACGPGPAATSAVPNADATHVALVVGDFGTGGPDQEAVAEAMEATARTEDADWFITTGDNFYTDDVEEVWSDPFGWVAESGMEVVATLGNHDVTTAVRRELVTAQLDMERAWYRTMIGPAVVLVLNSNQVELEDQMAWLEAALDQAADELVVVVFHHPAYSCSDHGPNPAVVEQWVPLFEGHDVDLVLNGHDHNYQRLVRGGITYVVTGGGGAILYPVGSCPTGVEPPVAADDTRHHYLVMTIGAKGIATKALAVDGEILDQFTVAP